MKSTVLAVVRQWFVSRVDDGAIELHPLIDVVHDVIGTLAQLKIDLGLWLRQLKIKRKRVGLADPACPGENLAGGQESQQCAEHGRSKLGVTFHQIILVATKGGTGVVIDIILDERDPAGRT